MKLYTRMMTCLISYVSAHDLIKHSYSIEKIEMSPKWLSVTLPLLEASEGKKETRERKRETRKTLE